MNREIKLGQKVKCHSYIKRNGNWIEEHSNCLRVHNKKTQLVEPLDYGEGVVVNEIVKKDFEGFICGKKSVHRKINGDWFDSIDVGIGYLPGGTRFEKYDYINCYEVCVENKNKSWGKRYVPTYDVEIINKQEA